MKGFGIDTHYRIGTTANTPAHPLSKYRDNKMKNKSKIIEPPFICYFILLLTSIRLKKLSNVFNSINEREREKERNNSKHPKINLFFIELWFERKNRLTHAKWLMLIVCQATKHHILDFVHTLMFWLHFLINISNFFVCFQIFVAETSAHQLIIEEIFFLKKE